MSAPRSIQDELDLHTLAKAAGVDPGAAQMLAPYVRLMDALLQERMVPAPARQVRTSPDGLLPDGLLPDGLYSYKQAAVYLGVSAKTVKNWANAGQIKAQPGGRIYGVHIMSRRGQITHAEADAYLQGQRQGVLTLIKSSYHP